MESYFPELWRMTESFAGENEALTKALQITLSEVSSSAAAARSPVSSPSPHFRRLADPEPAIGTRIEAAGPGSDRARNGGGGPKGRISKRKSRALKRLPTTYIAADPANFRRMVQEATGGRFGRPSLPVEPEADQAGSVLDRSWLPTLDTSAILLERDATSSAFDFESFPTLESCGVMGGVNW